MIFFKDKTPVHTNTELAETPVEINEIYTRIVHRGESSDIRLADGSIIKLNSDSKLLYPRYFEGDERLVELSGEAFFMIKPNKNKPFKVKIGEIITEVVGTEFNIKARANEDIELIVVEGSVKVYNEKTKNSNSVNVNPGEFVTYSENRGFSNPRKAELKHHTAWLQNKISFRNEKLGRVMEEIERIYNVKVKFQENEIESKRLTGVFTKESLNETLTAISISMNINIVYEENTIFISNNN